MTSQPQTTRRRRLIVNADDFGASPQTNRAILQAFEKRLISSATIMANMPAFEEACQLARQNNLQGKLGLHLNLTEGRPLTGDIAACPRFSDASGCWRPRRTVLSLSGEVVRLLEAEIEAQIVACQRAGIIPTHLDSHHHIHTQFGICGSVIRAAKRHGISAIRLAPNCRGAAAAIIRMSKRSIVRIRRIHNCERDSEMLALHRRTLARSTCYAYNIRLRLHGLAKTEYFGDASETARILQTTSADVEVMVHPRLDYCGRLVDLNGHSLESLITPLHIRPEEMCSYAGLGVSCNRHCLLGEST